VIDRCVDALGGLDGVVNNAGIYYTCASHEQERGRLETIVEVNLLGAMYVGTHAMRVMVEHGHGAIVNNASASHMGAPGTAAYAATKGALATLTYCWAIDMAPYGVRVNAFSPNASTRMTAESVNPAARNAPPVERNVPAVIYLLSDHADGISGQIVQLRDNDLVVLAHPQLSRRFRDGRRVDARHGARAVRSCPAREPPAGRLAARGRRGRTVTDAAGGGPAPRRAPLGYDVPALKRSFLSPDGGPLLGAGRYAT
jgi:short-subunit dehydrogenase involved in D-alanine esterification of teichoic acids